MIKSNTETVKFYLYLNKTSQESQCQNCVVNMK